MWHRDSRRSCDTSGVVEGGVARNVRLNVRIGRLAVGVNGNARVRCRSIAISLVARRGGVAVRRADGNARVSRRSISIGLSVLSAARNGRLAGVAQGQNFALGSRRGVDGHVLRGVVLRLGERSLRILIILAFVGEVVDRSRGRLGSTCGLAHCISL